MRNDCDKHEKNLQCPMCRAVLLEYFNDVEMPRNPLHIESNVENENVPRNINQNEENDRRHNNSLLYLFLMIIILVLLVIITIGR